MTPLVECIQLTTRPQVCMDEYQSEQHVLVHVYLCHSQISISHTETNTHHHRGGRQGNVQRIEAIDRAKT